MITWLLTGTDKELAVLLTERSERERLPVGVDFVKFEMPVGDPKKKKTGKQAKGYRGLETNYKT